jgi:light-regulated signal transduction histidine kinase (bacteriophytochrome)
LIQNGIKYNESTKPVVKIESFKKENQLILVFEDNGIGIKEEYYDQIFQFFKRLHNPSEYVGTGLGLGLCKKIIEKYNGNIHVNSELQVFTQFIITLPIVNMNVSTEKF